MGRGDDRLDVTAHLEICGHFRFPWIKKVNQVIHNLVSDVFVVDPLITILIDVELETLEFDAPLFGHILNLNGREIRKTGDRTNTSKLRVVMSMT